ncbi:hypothetical protein GW7_08383 [Heterocephalus glaber]|uniref:Katanin p80 subunit C-terminal domain-containing protein n=1 Tax=Heterocephalus glaber TaxID=10181 RepID=G5BR52_HETGA|nr:hypothetical protein GW7_08383 [Heterocephalus glaber]
MEKLTLTAVNEFILLGITDHPELQDALFLLFLLIYLTLLLGNLGMSIPTQVDPRLQTPMYFFLRQLVLTDLGYSTALGHKILVNFVLDQNTISYYSKKSPRSGGCDMGNKENELACAGHLPEKLHHNVFNSSDSGSSQTESPSSKYSGFFSEVSQDHETMAQVLFIRKLRLNVALTFWRKRSISELVAYLVKIEDLRVVVDCLPVLTNSLQEEKQYISLGCCVDLLPLVKSLRKSKFEEYVIVGLNWLQAVIKRRWSELSSKTDIINDRNIQISKQQLSRLWEQENHLTLVPGYTGNIAKDVDAYLLQLH